jgi:hypothetical protein
VFHLGIIGNDDDDDDEQPRSIIHMWHPITIGLYPLNCWSDSLIRKPVHKWWIAFPLPYKHVYSSVS